MMETEIESTTPAPASSTSDDRIWAALAHASAMFAFLGPVGAVILWFTQRQKSSYVAFQALQAMIYQSLFFWLYFTLIPLGAVVLILAWIFGVVLLAPDTNDPFLIAFVPQIVMWVILLGSFVAFWLIAIVAAVQSLMGRDFRYPLIGHHLARFVGYDGSLQTMLLEDREDRVVAAISHSTFPLMFLGLFTPLAVWITQHQRSAFLKFQAWQATIYQVIGAAGYAAFMALDLLFVFGSMGAMILAGAASTPSAMPVLLGLTSLPFLCVMCIFLIALPLYHLFGFLATLGVLRGRDFRYPVLGGILASRMKAGEGK